MELRGPKSQPTSFTVWGKGGAEGAKRAFPPIMYLPYRTLGKVPNFKGGGGLKGGGLAIWHLFPAAPPSPIAPLQYCSHPIILYQEIPPDVPSPVAAHKNQEMLALSLPVGAFEHCFTPNTPLQGQLLSLGRRAHEMTLLCTFLSKLGLRPLCR